MQFNKWFKLGALLTLVICTTLVYGQRSHNTKTNFYLEYATFSKTIIIKGKVVFFQEWMYTYDNPISSMPSSRKEVNHKFELSAKDSKKFLKQVRKSGFFNLSKKEYGEVPENRNYSTSIEISHKNKSKKIIYRSSPAPIIESVPNAFSTLEKLVLDLIKKNNTSN